MSINLLIFDIYFRSTKRVHGVLKTFENVAESKKCDDKLEN